MGAAQRRAERRREGAHRRALFVAPFAEPVADVAAAAAKVEHRVVFDFAIAFSNGDVRISRKRIVVDAHRRAGDGFVGQG